MAVQLTRPLLAQDQNSQEVFFDKTGDQQGRVQLFHDLADLLQYLVLEILAALFHFIINQRFPVPSLNIG